MALKGLYESIITESLSRDLESIDEDRLSIERRKLLPSEAGDRLALHLGRVLMSALSSVNDKDRVDVGVDDIGQSRKNTHVQVSNGCDRSHVQFHLRACGASCPIARCLVCPIANIVPTCNSLIFGRFCC